MYRLQKADEALLDAKLLVKNNRWNACINRLYYACYYAVSALLLKEGITTLTHTGLKTQFNLQFIKPNLLSKTAGKLYADLMDWRQKGDYGDMFDFTQNEVEPLVPQVEKFLSNIKHLINPGNSIS